jgi:phosphoribosylglycinamide formyltransferase-1
MLAVLDGLSSRALNATVELVISNRPKAIILDRARAHGIPAVHADTTDPSGKRMGRESYDRVVDQLLISHSIDLVILIGYMRILSPWFCDRWRGRLINVHPSLLPDFAGGMDQDVHRAVLESHRTQTGCTVHLVTSDVDAGPILLQKRCPVRLGDTPDTLKARVQDLEGKALLEVIEGFIDQM